MLTDDRIELQSRNIKEQTEEDGEAYDGEQIE
jgi:hypothetical protein